MKDTHTQPTGSAEYSTSQPRRTAQHNTGGRHSTAQADGTAQHSTAQPSGTVPGIDAPDPTGRGAPPIGTGAPPTPEAQADAEAQAVPQADAAAAGTDERTDEGGGGAQLPALRAVRFGSHGGYTQMRTDLFRRAVHVSHGAAAVYGVLSAYEGTQAAGFCFRSLADLCEDVGRCKRTVRDTLRALQDAGLLLILYRSGRAYGFFFPDGVHERPDLCRLPAAALRFAYGAEAREAVAFDPARKAFVPFGAPLDTEAKTDTEAEADGEPLEESFQDPTADPRKNPSTGAESDAKDPWKEPSTRTPGKNLPPVPLEESFHPNRQKEKTKKIDNNNNNSTRTHEAETSGGGRTDGAPVVVVGDSVKGNADNDSTPNSTADAHAQAETAGTDGSTGNEPALSESILRADGVRMAPGTAREILRQRGEAWAQAAFQHARKNADRSVAGYICALHRRDWTPKKRNTTGTPQGRGGCWGDYGKPTSGTGPDGRGGWWGPEYLEEGSGMRAQAGAQAARDTDDPGRTAAILKALRQAGGDSKTFAAAFRRRYGRTAWLERIDGRDVTEAVRVCRLHKGNTQSFAQRFPFPASAGTDGAQANATAQPSGDGAAPDTTAPPTPTP